MACTEEELMAVVLNLSYQKGWITENEKLRIKTARTLSDKKGAMHDLINSVECDDNATKLILSMRCVHEMNTPDLPKGDENRFLPSIMSKLFEKGLVSEEEKLDYEMQQLLVEKEMDGQENLSDVNFVDANPEGMETGIIKNPLEIGLVIKRVLQYLSFEEIKESRLVSKEWASVGLNALVDRSKITFNPAIENDINETVKRRGPINFFQDFPEQTEENKAIPFSHFEFEGQSFSNFWTIEELNYFFRNQQQYITELEFSDIYLVDDDGEDVDSFNITPWIANSPIAIKNSEKNTKLKIKVHSFEDAKLSVDSDVLSNVKDLEIYGCKVNLKGGSRITPIRLNIEDTRFTKEGNQLAELCVNDFVDFSKAKRINIYGDFDLDSGETKLSLDLNGCQKLDSLDLSFVAIINWKTSNWKIDKLRLLGIPFKDLTEIQIKKLHFEDAEINVSLLPQSLEELLIESDGEDMLLSTHPIIFYNLKCLELHLISSGFSTFFQNVKCPNLVEVHMVGLDNDLIAMDFAWLPCSLKILCLEKLNIKNQEGRNFNLDKLVLADYQFSHLIEICTAHIQAKDLVLVHPWTKKPSDAFSKFSNLLENQKRFQDLGQRIYISVKSKYFLPKVENSRDGFDKYFVYENNLGKSIDSDEFDEISVQNTVCRIPVVNGILVFNDI